MHKLEMHFNPQNTIFKIKTAILMFVTSPSATEFSLYDVSYGIVIKNKWFIPWENTWLAFTVL